MLQGTYYDPFYLDPSSNTSELQILPPEKNLQPSPRDCCISCMRRSGCNAWQWCVALGRPCHSAWDARRRSPLCSACC